jgi:hypothetical protein
VSALIGRAAEELLLSSSQTVGTRGTETKQCGARLDVENAGVRAHQAGRLAGDRMEAGVSERATAGCGEQQVR